MCGSTGSFGAGGGDIYLTLLDPNGEIIWSKTYGGTGVEQGNCVRETADGGFIIAGLTNSFGAGGYDGYVVRTDAAGFQLWDETFGGSDWDVFYSIVIVDDGIVVAGQSYSDGSVNGDAWLIKLNDIGALDWTSISGMSGADCIESIIRTTSGKFFAAGYSSPADAHATIFGIASDGSFQNSNVYTEGPGSFGHGITVVSDSMAVLVGEAVGLNGKAAMLLRKVDETNGTVWTDVLSQSDDCIGYGIVERANGILAVAGYTKAFGNGGAGGGGGGICTCFLKTPGGWYEFGTTYGTIEDNLASDLVETTDHEFVLCGTTQATSTGPMDIFLVRTDSSGFTASEVIIEQFDPLIVGGSISTGSIRMTQNPGTVDTPIHLSGFDPDMEAIVSAFDCTGRLFGTLVGQTQGGRRIGAFRWLLGRETSHNRQPLFPPPHREAWFSLISFLRVLVVPWVVGLYTPPQNERAPPHASPR
ncbi:MAG: hypothetical protein IPI55_12885 [Flavobacteriales bacterium]|nr:hypothetical protein [Flavobacteriales bacterium]